MPEKLRSTLGEIRNLYRLLLKNTNDGIAIADETGRFVYANYRFLEMLGYPEEEIIGHESGKFVQEEEKKRWSEQTTGLRKAGAKRAEVIWNKNDQSRLFTLISSSTVYDEKRKSRGILLVITDITERRLAEQELNRSREELRNLSRHIQTVREEESKRISRKIHDELGQALTAIKMDLAWLVHKFPKEYIDQRPINEKIESMSELLDKIIQSTQKISAELRPGLLDDLGLVPAIEWQIQDFQSRTAIPCRVKLDVPELELDPDRSTAVFRVFQEALINIVRHAGASRVKIRLTKREEELELRISDNGIGIEKEKIFSPDSLGLIGMRERLRFFNGELMIVGRPKKGTDLKIRIPLKQKEKS